MPMGRLNHQNGGNCQGLFTVVTAYPISDALKIYSINIEPSCCCYNRCFAMHAFRLIGQWQCLIQSAITEPKNHRQFPCRMALHLKAP